VPYKINFSLDPIAGDMVIAIDAPYFGDSPIPDSEPGKFETLYQHEVVEVFLGSKFSLSEGFDPYVELNVGPHGHYNLVYFVNEAEWDTQDTTMELENLPKCQIHVATKRWTCSVRIPHFFLPQPVCTGDDDLSVEWTMNCYAIHGPEDNRTYWAANRVPGLVPNFHQLASFTPLALIESAGVRQTVDRGVSMVTDLVRQSARYRQSDQRCSSGDSQGSIGVFDSMTLDEVARMIQTSDQVVQQGNDKKRDSKRAAMLTLDDKFLKYIHDGEFVVLYGYVWKRSFLSYRKRMLILTSKARLLYVASDGVYRGTIPWSLTKPITITKVNQNRFDIIIFDKTRVYHLSDGENGSDRWVNGAKQLLRSQRAYFLKHLSLPPSSSKLMQTNQIVETTTYSII
jgi:hypothetical protein